MDQGLDETRKEFARQSVHMDSAPAFHAERVLQRLVSAVRSAPAERVLDLACGPGILAQAIARDAHHVLGVDVTPEMVALAKQRFQKARLQNGRFLVGAAEQLPVERETFDQLITRLSFHHFTDVPSVLAEARRVLRREGQLVVADVVSSEDADESALHNSLEKLRDPTHVRMYSAGNLLDILHYGGFRVVHHESWRQARTFSEWAAIVGDPKRTTPLETVMRALARAGQTAGIGLREESGELRFAHTWLLAIAVAG